jgi:hypothetical protein
VDRGCTSEKKPVALDVASGFYLMERERNRVEMQGDRLANGMGMVRVGLTTQCADVACFNY